MSRARHAKKPVLGDKVSMAKVRYYGVGPRKVRMVADLIRGLTVAQAEHQLMVLHKPSGAPIIHRLLKSAMSNANQNAEQKHQPEDLIVGTICVDSGPFQRRFQPAPMGRALPIRKRTSHVTDELYTQV